MTIDEIEATLRLERRSDGRAFIVAGGHVIARQFIVRVVVEYAGCGYEGIYIETVASRVTLAEVETTQQSRARLNELAGKIIALWVGE